MTLVAGTRLGPYEILECLGAGGMGEVYRARDTKLGRDVAVKVLPADRLADETVRRRFRKEAHALSRLSHPHIATIHDFGCEEGIDFLVLELVTGPSLTALLRDGPLPEKDILRLGAQLARGLQAAHDHGIVHRDLKPSNLHLTPDGLLKILDFGLARLERPAATLDDATPTRTAAGEVMGTPPYMSPEQLLGKPVDSRTDIYATGACLYELATAARPYGTKRGPQLTAAVLNDMPVPPRARNAAISAGLEALILKALDKQPALRYQTARELLVDLERLQPGGGPGRAGEGLNARNVERHRAWRWTAVALAMVVTVAVAVTVRSRAGRRGAPAPIHALAVLPFENLMKDPAQDFFVEGLHAAVLTELGRLGPFRVTSRTSVMRYRPGLSEGHRPLRETARALEVDAIVEGSVLRFGDRVRITAVLIRGETDEQLWAGSYDRDVRDVLTLLSEVSHAIADEVRATVSLSGGPERGPAPRSVRPEVYEAYLLGQHAGRSFGAGSLAEALASYRKAAILDPTFAPAWGGIAAVRVVQAAHRFVPVAEALPEARKAAQKALSLERRTANAQSALANIALYFDWDVEKAGRIIEDAVRLDPSDSGLRQVYADYLLLTGRVEEGLAQARLGRQYDPLWPAAYYQVAYQAISARRYDEAISEGRRMLRMFPEASIAHWPIGLALWLKGQPDEALVEWRARSEADEASAAEWRARFGADDCLRALEGGYRSAGTRAGLAALAECTASKAMEGELDATEPAMWYAACGDSDRAFEWLERSYAQHEYLLLFAVVNPLFDPIRDDPRFASLLGRIGVWSPQAAER